MLATGLLKIEYPSSKNSIFIVNWYLLEMEEKYLLISIILLTQKYKQLHGRTVISR